MTLESAQTEPTRLERIKNLAQHWGRFLRRGWPGFKVWPAAAILGVVLLLVAGYVLLGRPVTLIVGTESHLVRSHRSTIAGALDEIGLVLEPEDIVRPPLDTRLSVIDNVFIELARPVTIEIDGQTLQMLTHSSNITGVLLDDAGLKLNPRDEILANGQTIALDAWLPPPIFSIPDTAGVAANLFATHTPRGAISAARPEPVQLIVRRAVPVTLNDGRVRSTFYTAQPNVGEALLEQNITVFLGDKVTPDLGTRLSPGMKIYIQRSIPVNITVDGRTIKTRTRRSDVGELLAQEGVALMGQDFVRPALDGLLTPYQFIEVVRVNETVEIEQELIPFESRWVPDPEMDIDTQEVRQAGNTGAIKTRTRVRYENGQEVSRNVEDEWLDEEPADRMIAYGTHITVRTLETENGPIEYWRKIPMLATGYTAATSGKDKSHPLYGITRSGLQAGFGLVAVDPKVIPLMTNLYVPNYGPALAADTGGKVLGKHIDLGFDEDKPIPDTYGWRDVYVLTPVPSPDNIRYVLPNWPQRR